MFKKKYILIVFIGAFIVLVPDWGDDFITKAGKTISSGNALNKIKSISQRHYHEFLDRYIYADIESSDWLLESHEERNRLPEYKVIEATSTSKLTPANSKPVMPAVYRTWHRSHGDSASTHFSRLEQINSTNVTELEIAWVYRSGSGSNNVQSNPIIADGLVYSASSRHDVVALDATTGDEVWKFDPDIDFPARRGLVWWIGDDKNRARIFFPAGNRLFAVDAQTGQPAISFGGGSVNIGAISKIAPAIAGNIIVTASVKPAVHGFDVITGKHLWSTDLSAKDQPLAPGGRPSKLKGGNPWGGIALDEKRKIAYITTGNPSPVLVGVDRPGNNPLSVSVIAIDINEGTILWSFQEIPHDLWDLDIAAPPILTTIERESKKVDVVAVVTKAGNTLLLDRVTGDLVFDFRLRRAPTSKLPGERTAPYQPDLELPEPFAKQAFELSDVTNIGKSNRKSVLEIVKTRNTGFYTPHEEGVETVFFGLHGGAQWPGAAVNPDTGYLFVASSHVPSMVTVINVAGAIDESKLPITAGRKVYLNHCAGCHGFNRGGASAPSLIWLDLRFTPKAVESIVENGSQAMQAIENINKKDISELIEYLFSRDISVRNKTHKSNRNGDYRFVRSQYRKLKDNEGYPGSKPPWGTLNAIDLNTGHIVWKVPLGEYPELTARGIPKTGTENISGPLATAGGIIFASGTKDRMIRAFDSNTGAELWAHKLPFNGSAAPSTYMIDGRQFLVIPATGGGTLKLYDSSVEVGDAIVAFALPQD